MQQRQSRGSSGCQVQSESLSPIHTRTPASQPTSQTPRKPDPSPSLNPKKSNLEGKHRLQPLHLHNSRLGGGLCRCCLGCQALAIDAGALRSHAHLCLHTHEGGDDWKEFESESGAALDGGGTWHGRARVSRAHAPAHTCEGGGHQLFIRKVGQWVDASW